MLRMAPRAFWMGYLKLSLGNCSPLCVALTRAFGIERITGG
jgi:non-homologous end joining protein Ku